MSTLAIETNDTGIVAVDATGLVVPPSPGYALQDGETLLTGDAALDSARLKPRRVTSRFWERLDASQLPRPFTGGLNHADLVHAHLTQFWSLVGRRPVPRGADGEIDEVLLACPGVYTHEQLGLLVGIAQACGIPVTGLVDVAVGASAMGYPGERLLHLDLLLHRVILTVLSQDDDLVRRRVEVLEESGLVELQDLWAKLIADLFVGQTRFDPLHLASTEQDLYRRIPEWLTRLSRAETATLILEAGGKEHLIEVTLEELVEAVLATYDRIVRLVEANIESGTPATLLFSHRIALLPDLKARLIRAVGPSIVELPPSAAAAGALMHRERIRSAEEELPFVTRLPANPATPRQVDQDDDAAETQATASDTTCPTHVLHEGQAYPITSEPFVLGVAIANGSRGLELAGDTSGISRSHCSIYRVDDDVVVEDHSQYGSFLNSERFEGRVSLATGDRLRLGTPGVELQLIAVSEIDGT